MPSNPNCPDCRGTGWRYSAPGAGVSRCSCVGREAIEAKLAQLPAIFRSADLEAKPVSALQATIFAEIRRQPNRSLYLYGPYGSGKSHAAAGQFRACAEAGIACCSWRTVYGLTAELRAHEIGEGSSTVLALAAAAAPYHLWIDDFHEIHRSDWSERIYHELLDAILRAGHALTITANCSIPGLARIVPGSVASRIERICGSGMLLE